MAEVSHKKKIWGWMFFDWASQPYNTLVLTFVFGPYFAQIVSNDLMVGGMAEQAAKAQAQSYWGWGLTAVGIFIAICAPIFGAIADNSGRRMPWIWFFSILYVVGAAGLWWATPPSFNITIILMSFGIGMIGMEFATIFTNAILPDLGTKDEIGRISGSGWAFGYWGGVLLLALMLLFFAESEKGTTLLGIEPIFGLDPDMREGTRSVGPLTAIWYAVFMIPFFLWVKEKPRPDAKGGIGVSKAVSELMETLRRLPETSSLFAYLVSSMFYRDALNGMFTFGGIYAFGVLEWSVVDVGVFGILAAITGAIFAWAGGIMDQRLGPKPVIFTGIFVLLLTSIAVVMISRDAVFGIPVEASSKLPDIAFYICGGLIGAAGGALQSASRTMLVRQANPARMTEAFGLYALAGKATSFLAPAAIAMATTMTGSQRLGVVPLIALFAIGLILMLWVKPDRPAAKE